MDEDDPVRGAVARQIALTITVDVEPLYHVPALNGRLPDGGVDRLFVPHGVARRTSPFRESGPESAPRGDSTPEPPHAAADYTE
jgi:hypothetical protein